MKKYLEIKIKKMENAIREYNNKMIDIQKRKNEVLKNFSEKISMLKLEKIRNNLKK